MVRKVTMIAVNLETRERIYRLKGPQKTYDAVVSEAITLLEEKLDEHRPQAETNETGNNHEGDQ